MQTSIAKRIFAVGTSMAMLLTGFAFTASAAAHGAGTNVVSNGTVYWINSAGQKQAYTSAGAFLSYGFNSWSNVVPATAEDLALPNGSYVPPMDGSLINDKGTVYLMTNGQRAGFTSAAVFTGLGYSFKNVIAGDTSFLPSAANINSTAMAHPVGTLVNDSGTVYLMTASGKMGIPSLSVFNSWGYSFAHVVPANSYDTATPMSSGIMQAIATGQLNPTGTTGTVTPPVSGGVNVSVDNLTPASGSIAKTAKVTFTKFDFTAGSQAATINSMVVTRLGLSSDSDVSNVYLYDSATGTQLAVGSFNLGRVTFIGSPLFTVNANSTKTVEVRADMGTTANATTGDSIGYGIASAADVNLGGATVGGSFPVNGNLMTIAAVANIGAVTITSPSNLSTTINPGTQGATIGYFQLAGSNQPLSVTYLKLTNVGSVAQSDIQNIKLYNGSTQVGTTMQQAADKTVTFDLSSSPMIIPSGTTVNLYLKGDVMGGSNRNFQFTIQRTSDILVTDTTYATGIVPGLGTSTGTAPIPSGTTNQVSVNAGTATLQVSTTSPTGNIPTTASGVTLSTFNFTASGEDVRVSAITVSTTTTGANLLTGATTGSATDYFKNGKLVDITGGGSVQVGSTTNLNVSTVTGGGTVTTAISIPGYWTIPAGTTRTLAVIADTTANLAPAANLNAGTIHADLTSVTAQGATSLSTVTFGTATGRTLTLTSGSLTAAANAALANIAAVKGQTGVKVASFQITAGTSEGANITQIQLTAGGAGTDFQNLKAMVGSTQIGSSYGSITASGVYSFSPATQWTIPAGGSAVVDVYADILAGSGAVNTFNLTGITATGSVDNQTLTATGTPVTGQQVTINANGTLTVAADSQAPTAAQLQQLPMGATQQTLAVFNLAASNVENINVTSIQVTDTETSGKQGDLANFKLYVNGAQVGQAVPSESGSGTTGTITFNMQSSPLVVPQNQNVSVYVKADVSVSPTATSGDSHNLNLASSAVTALGAVSGVDTTGGSSAAVSGVAAKVFKTTLTIAKDASSPSGLSAASATQTIAVMNVTNAANLANAQATFMPACTATTTGLTLNLSSTAVPVAAAARLFKIFKATDLTTAIATVTLTPTAGSGTWTTTLTFTCTNTTQSIASSTANLVASAASWTPQVINAGTTAQYVVQMDTTDATSQKSFTLSIPSAQGPAVWSDSSANVGTLMGAPVTFGTLTY